MNFPESFSGWMATVFIVLAGGVAAYGQVDQIWRARKKGDGEADDRLISLLKQTVEELTTRVDLQNKAIEELNKKMEWLERDNKTLTAVLQGRDGQTIDFQKQMLQAVVKGNEMHELCVSTNTNVERLCGLMESHMKAIEAKS